MAPPATSTRYQSLDHWRGLACLMVLAYHSTFYVAGATLDRQVKSGAASLPEVLLWTTSRMWIGVPIFFVISGYCIAASAVSHQKHCEPAGRFFLKRLRRIYPPYWIFLAIAVPLIAAAEYWQPHSLDDGSRSIPAPWKLSAWQWLGSLTLTETWRYHLIGDAKLRVIGHIWTLCYEEQFYLVAGLILLIRPKRFFPASLAIVLLVAIVATFTPPQAIRGFFFDGLYLQFAAGMAVCYAVNFASRAERYVIAAALAAALAWQCRTLAPWLELHGNDPQSYGVAYAFALALLAMHPYDRRLAEIPVLKPLAFFGLMCYSLYLIHWPVVKFIAHSMHHFGFRGAPVTLLATLPICLAASVALTWPFHVLVERRFLSSPKAVTREPSALPELA